MRHFRAVSLTAGRALVTFAAFAVLTACASSPRLPTEEELRVKAILDAVSTRYAEDEEARRCLPTQSYRSIEIIDESRLIFWARNGGWLNDLRQRCPGMRPNDILRLDIREGRACALDRVSAIERGVNVLGPKATCVLGTFKPIPPGQAEAVRALLRGKPVPVDDEE